MPEQTEPNDRSRSSPAAARRPLTVAGIAAIALLAAAAWWMYEPYAFFPPTPVQDPARYAEVRATFSAPYVAHFPASVPPTATNVKMYYYPGVMQAPRTLELRYRLPADEFAAAATAAEAQHAAFSPPAGAPDITHTDFHTDPPGTRPPESRRSLQLDAGPGLDS